ncbi:MAG: hypothetical protein R3E89_11975 [Thiolinea sp.]
MPWKAFPAPSWRRRGALAGTERTRQQGEAVAHMYLLAAVFTLCITLNFSHLERLLKRRRV